MGRRDAPPVPPENLHADAFRHGFVAAGAGVSAYAPPSWPVRTVGALRLHTHPVTAVATADDSAGVAIAVLGQALDLDAHSVDGQTIAAALAASLTEHGVEEFVRRTAYLGGRFVVLAVAGDVVHVLGDSHAAQPAYWAAVGTRVAIGSHPTLVAQSLGLGPDDELLDAWSTVREVRPKGTVFLPGVRTPYASVRPVMANCRLELDLTSGDGRHTRFAPFTDRIERDTTEVIEDFVDQLDRHLALLVRLGRIGVSLTSGSDSLVALAALTAMRPAGTFAFTYVNPRELAKNTRVQNDVFGASARAFALEMPHRLLRWRASEAGEDFDTAFHQTWPLAKPSAGAANAMYADLPHDFFELQNTVSETGTGFYRDRHPDFDARRLTALWASPAAADRAPYVRFFEEFIDYSGFTEAAMRGYDYHDLFYWEVRNSRWAAEKYQVGDLSHRVMLPYNSRRLIETMLSLPQEQRFAKTLLTTYVERRAPAGLH